MEFRILGPLGATAGGRGVALPAAKQRALLAILLLNANQPVSTERLNELARLASAGEPLRAAQLLGCASAPARALNDPLVGPGKIAAWITTLRTVLGAQPFADAWARGRSMTVHDAVRYALAEDDVTPVHA